MRRLGYKPEQTTRMELTVDYLIEPVSLAEPSDSNCRVVRGADNVQLYVGSRAACERFIDRCHQFDIEFVQRRSI